MTDKINDLIARVEVATGPDRELDIVIHSTFFPSHVTVDVTSTLPAGFGRDTLSMLMAPHPAYTSSVDAALALTERLLSGFGNSIERHPVYGDWWDAAVFDRMPRTISNARKQTAPLAILLATLRAYKESNHVEG